MDHQEEQGPLSLIDWLNLSVHFDLGEGHLENFPQVDNSDLSVDVQIFNLDDMPLLSATVLSNVEIASHPVISLIEYRRALFGRDTQFEILPRGPPSNV